MEKTTAKCGSPSSRGRGRGRGRGLPPRALNNSKSTVISAEQIVKTRLAIAKARKNEKKLPADLKKKLATQRQKKQINSFLVPSATEPKRGRKGSPERMVCPLAPNTPAVPPLPKRQPWQPTSEDPNNLNDPLGDFVSSNDDQAEQPVTVILQPSADFICSSSTAMCLADGDIKFNVVPNVDMEFVDFKATSIVQKSEASSEMAPTISQDFTFDDFERYNSDHESDIDEIDETIGESDFIDINCRRDVWCQKLDDETLAMLGQNDASDDSALRDLASSSVEDVLHFDWSGDPDVFTGQRETFTGQSGPTFDKEGMTPFEVLQKIWDTEIINLIVQETNSYAKYCKVTGRHAYLTKTWTDITSDEVWIYFAVLMLQSIYPIPVEREYWFPRLSYFKQNFSKIMPHKRFMAIKCFMSFVDYYKLKNDGGDTSRLNKIKPLINHLNDKFSSLYLPGQNIAIDESLLLWKGRLSFSQLIATKTAKVGIKSYELCESSTGYLWKMIVYTGKGEAHTEQTNTDEPLGATSQIVYSLIRPLLYKGHTVIMDNFYNSPLLSRMLKRQRTDTVGTLRINRQFVPDGIRNTTKSNTRPGEVVISQTHDLAVLVWHDSNMVAMISSYHKPMVGGKEKYGYYKYKPQVVLDYNMAMGGVDKKDQMLQAFPVERIRNLKWYKKLFRRLLNVSIYNAFIIYNHGQNMSQRKFRLELVDEIIKKLKPQQDPCKANPRIDHFPSKASGKARCKWCSKHKKTSRTTFQCDTCGTALCIIDCFRDYHLYNAF